MNRIFILLAAILVLNGCTNNVDAPNQEKINQSINDATFPADNAPVVGDVKDENSIGEPIKAKLSDYYKTKSVSDFEVTNYSKLSKMLFCTINFKVDGKLHYGLVQAYSKDKGWVILTIDENQEIPNLAVALQMTVGNELIEENNNVKSPFRIYSGYIHDKKVKEIDITTTDDRMYIVKIGDDQKQFLYVSPRQEQKAKIVALDKDGKVVFQQ